MADSVERVMELARAVLSRSDLEGPAGMLMGPVQVRKVEYVADVWREK